LARGLSEPHIIIAPRNNLDSLRPLSAHDFTPEAAREIAKDHCEPPEKFRFEMVRLQAANSYRGQGTGLVQLCGKTAQSVTLIGDASF
jgi:hypothetical protein